MCVYVCLCDFMHTTCLQVPIEARRGHQIPLKLEFRQY